MRMSWPAGTLGSSGPAQMMRLGSLGAKFATIVLNDDAAEQAADNRLRSLLERISNAAKEPHARQAIAAVLREQDIDPVLAQAEIYMEGTHRISDTIAVVAGTARVEASGAGIILAVGKAGVRARGLLHVWVTDEVRLDAYDYVRVDASGHARVNSYDKVVGTARDKVTGSARSSSAWVVEGDCCFFDTMDHAELRGSGGTFRAYGRSRIHAGGRANVLLYESANGWFKGLVQAMLEGNAIAYTEETVSVSIRGDARKLPLTA